MVENSTKIQQSEHPVIAGKWYHVMVEYQPVVKEAVTKGTAAKGIKLNVLLNLVSKLFDTLFMKSRVISCDARCS